MCHPQLCDITNLPLLRSQTYTNKIMGKKWQSARGEASAAPTIRKAALTHHPVPLAIIGGGAAGLFAAAAAARRRIGCLVFERKARIGSKLLMTANGRCNFTKDISAEQMLADIGEPVASFVAPALRRCPPSMIAAGFKARGLAIKRRADGCLFPASGRRMWCMCLAICCATTRSRSSRTAP